MRHLSPIFGLKTSWGSPMIKKIGKKNKKIPRLKPPLRNLGKTARVKTSLS